MQTGDRWSYHGRSGSDAAFGGPSTDFGVTLDTKEGKWSFYAYGKLLQPYDYTFWLSSRELVGGLWKEVNTVNTEPKTESAHFSTHGDLPAGPPGPIRGVWDVTHGSLATGKSDYHATVLLVPEYKDLELVVEIEGVAAGGKTVAYEKWIPRGTLNGGAGSRLKIKARLQAEDGGAVRAKVDVFTFALINTSREPGVCMNYPQVSAATAEKSSAPDLKFLPTGGTDADRQELEMPPDLGDPDHPHAEAQVDCFDFGGWSDLWVTAELADGRSITGHLKGGTTAIMMPLPKRSGGSYIADAWKAEQGVTAGDEDDSEKLPSAGKVPGDGFTLYEEYRGFVENGRHLRCDPKKIDFFVRNYIGGDAQAGIDLFTALTDAAVHSRLRDTEFDPEKRVMNANHDRGAHRVDQHGVYLRTKAGLDGAEAKFTTAQVRGRPRLCQEIVVQPRGAATSVTTSENVPVSDLVFAYDRAIAHELLHAVGVEHHGQRDYHETFQLTFFDSPTNKTGKAFFESLPAGTAATITDEATGRDLAVMLEPDLLLAREALRPLLFDSMVAEARKTTEGRGGPHAAEDFAETIFNLVLGTCYLYVGAEHGECSGDEICVSRYYFARLYQKKGVPHAYYYITNKRTEHAGLGLCHSRVGSGINASRHKPQPRYGDSNPGWGECANWIVFNDAAPNESAPKP